MLLFQKRFHAGLLDGSITITVRRWAKPLVRPGGRYRCHPIGVLEVDRVERVRLEQVTPRDARQAGFPDRAALLDYLRRGEDGPLDEQQPVFRITLHHGGDGDRVTIATDDRLSREDVALIGRKLERLDGRAERPWTRETLALIAAHPRVAASRLAEKLGRDKLAFKADVVKLKRLGLTQSFEVGYEISPRGRAFLAAEPSRR